ncbi:MAG: hydroxyquinol 1,2-dioxygenase [Gammaproteobacteria bacterium]|nr:hydroxyquinol 1,2-dioxygenase [Gammaproteobacteria bacterium]
MSNAHGYNDFTLGGFGFRRDEYFAHITWTTRDGKPMSHTLDAGNFLRALMRDVAWGFFYGWVNFDDVFGTVNHYGTVDIYAGAFNGAMKDAGVDRMENHPTSDIRDVFERMLADWTNAGFDPFAAPQETGSPYGPKNGDNLPAITRARELAKRCVGLQGDLALRTDAGGSPINRAFADVSQDAPELHPEPGFENEVHAFNLFAFLSRSQVTWNPSFTSVVKNSFMCPTTEEHILPIIHGNDRVEWFFQMCDEIHWNCDHKETGEPLARVIMKAGDMAAMPAYCRHKGFSPKRSMLLVWENGNPKLVDDIKSGAAPQVPVSF